MSSPDPIDAVAHLAAWSAWTPFADAVLQAPLSAGVYIAREGSTGPIVYVGMAGIRRGKGIRGRLGVYRSGKAAVSGLGEAAMDRALADESWLHERLAQVVAGQPERTTFWARAAIDRLNLHVCWAETGDESDGRRLEHDVLRELDAHRLWNRRRPTLKA
jgi:hypothetical protein